MGLYKIKDIEQLTGVKAHTIRIWEKRYNFFIPSRSETLIRMYSDEELTLLLKISILNKQGIKISRISEMSVQEIDKRITSLYKEDISSVHFESMLIALVEMDEILFLKIVDGLISEFGLEVTFVDYLLPFLKKIGVMWIVGSINPAQEHFITHLIRQKLISELNKLRIPTQKDKPFVLYLPENEWHEIGLMYYNYVLRKNNIFTIYLGQSLPLESLQICIRNYNPKALVTSIVSSMDEAAILRYVESIKSEFPNLEIYAGGYQADTFQSSLKKYVNIISSLDDLRRLLTI